MSHEPTRPVETHTWCQKRTASFRMFCCVYQLALQARSHVAIPASLQAFPFVAATNDAPACECVRVVVCPCAPSGCVLTPFGRVGTVGMERGYSWSFVPFQPVFRCLSPFQLQKEKAGIAANSVRSVTFWTVNIKHSVQL